MNDAKHTPGPWAVEDVSGVARQIYVTATDHRRGTPFIVALVYQKTPADQSQPEDVAANMANANLIAAAPDLLAACEYVLADNPNLRASTWRALNAALAKAKGGA